MGWEDNYEIQTIIIIVVTVVIKAIKCIFHFSEHSDIYVTI